jgi:hypothetical protein
MTTVSRPEWTRRAIVLGEQARRSAACRYVRRRVDIAQAESG